MPDAPTQLNIIASMVGEHIIEVMYFDFSRYLIAAGGMTILLWLASRWAEFRRIQSKRASRTDYVREVLSSFRSVFFFGITTLATLTLRELGVIEFKLESVAFGILAIQSVVMIVAHDAYFYWMHRGLHARRLYKATHLHHHKSRTPTPWTAYSFTAWEAVAEAAFVPLFLLAMSLLGFDWAVLAIFVFIWHQIIRNVIGHCGVEIYPRGWVDNPITGWWNTVTHHDLHHSTFNYNYGLYFTWWDRWMGTEHPEYRARFNAVAKPLFASKRKAAEVASIIAMSTFVAFTTISGGLGSMGALTV